MADVQITAPGVVAAPLDYLVPGSQEIIVKAAFATFDGTAAAAAFLPCLRVVSPGGKVVGEYVTDSSVAAGASADVSFFPRGKGGTATGGGVGVEHNDALVATEPNIDFEDGGGVTWTVTDDAPFSRVKIAAAAGGGALSWCFANSASVSVPNGTVTSTFFDFTGHLQTNDAVTYTLAAQGGGRETPSLNSNGIYIVFMVAQGSIGGVAPAAGSAMKIANSIYGNEPIGNPAVGTFYVDPITGFGQVKATWLWVFDLGGSGSSPPQSGEIGVRQNSGAACSTSVNFFAVRIDTTGDGII